MIEPLQELYDMEQTVVDLREILRQGVGPFNRALSAHIRGTSVVERAHYLLAGISAMEPCDPEDLRQVFDYLRQLTDPRDMGAHEQALVLAMRVAASNIMSQATALMVGLASSMGVESQLDEPDAENAHIDAHTVQ